MYQLLALLFGLRKRSAFGSQNSGTQNLFITLKRQITARASVNAIDDH